MKKIIVLIIIGILILQIPSVFATPTSEEIKNNLTNRLFKEYSEEEIIVKFKYGVSENRISKINSKYGTSVISKNNFADFHRVKIPNGKSLPEMIELYNNDPNVEYVEPNYIAYACMMPNDPHYSYQWHLHGLDEGGINIEPAWDISTGSGTVVAVIDTGIKVGSDLADTCFVAGYDFINNDNDPVDDNGHGTHVAGTVAQSTNNNIGVCGVAFDACLMPVKVLNEGGLGTYNNIIDGIEFAVDNGANIISMSLGGSSYSQALKDACEYAYDNGVTIIAAAGNYGLDSLLYPAAYDEYVIAVGATQYDKTLAPYSNVGTSLDLVAPGGNTDLDQNGDGYGDGVLQQTFTGNSWEYNFYEGTSMATPHVSGVAALLFSTGITSPDEIRNVMQSTAVDLGSTGWDMYYGYGLIDAYAALQNGGSPPPPQNTYSEDFEDELGEEWSFYSSSNYGRNERNTYSANSGSYSWRMDVTSNGNYNLNELILYVTVSEASYLDLSFSTREFNDERNTLPSSFIDHKNGDGIAVSNDGTSWTLLWQYPRSISGWASYDSLDISDYIFTDSDVYIKFQQYDNYRFTTDGIAWDDIKLESDGTITLIGEPPNNPPDAPDNPNPADGATDIGLNPMLSVDVFDFDGNYMDVTFYDASDNSVIGTDIDVVAGGTASTPWANLEYGTTYDWYAIADDGTDSTQSATWSFTTESAPQNDPPVAFDQSTVVDEDSSILINLVATDNDGDPLTYYIVDNPIHGSLSGSAPTVTYMPDANYYGSDSFTFKANDGIADSNIATVTITVSPINDAPVADEQSVTTIEDIAVDITLTASDMEGDSLDYIIVSGPSHGTLSGTAPNIAYLSDAGYSGDDSFTFKASDGELDSNIATVDITVNSDDPNTMHISNIEMSKEVRTYWKWSRVRALATVTIVDSSNNPVQGAIVSGQWSGLAYNSAIGSTNNNGEVTLYSNWAWNPQGAYTFTVTNVEKTDWTYDESSNVETSDSITP